MPCALRGCEDSIFKGDGLPVTEEHKEYEDFPQSELDCPTTFAMGIALSAIAFLVTTCVILFVIIKSMG